LLVDDRTVVSDDCGGAGRFAEFHDGQMIALLDASGQIVGEGLLADCRWTDWRLTGRRITAKPEFTFTISGVPETSSYMPRVGSTSWPPVTLTSIRDAGFRLVLVVD
jgi:hypothetical protein